MVSFLISQATRCQMKLLNSIKLHLKQPNMRRDFSACWCLVLPLNRGVTTTSADEVFQHKENPLQFGLLSSPIRGNDILLLKSCRLPMYKSQRCHHASDSV